MSEFGRAGCLIFVLVFDIELVSCEELTVSPVAG